MNLQHQKEKSMNVYCNRHVRNNSTTTCHSKPELLQQLNV